MSQALPALEEVVGYSQLQYCRIHPKHKGLCWSQPDVNNCCHILHFTFPIYHYGRYYTNDVGGAVWKTQEICICYPDYLEAIKRLVNGKCCLNNAGVTDQQKVCYNFIKKFSQFIQIGIKPEDIIYFMGHDGTLVVWLIKIVKPPSWCISFEHELKKHVVAEAIKVEIGDTFKKKMIVFESLTLVDLNANMFKNQRWGYVYQKPMQSFDDEGDVELKDVEIGPETDSKLFDMFSRIGDLLVQQYIQLNDDRQRLLCFYKKEIGKKIKKWLMKKNVGESRSTFATFPVDIASEFKIFGGFPVEYHSLVAKQKISQFLGEPLKKEDEFGIIQLADITLKIINSKKIKISYQIIRWSKIQRKWFPNFID